MILKKASIYIGILALFLFSGCQSVTEDNVPQARTKFTFTVLKAGQADAIFMQTQNHSIILDCGEKDDGDELAELLRSNGVTNADYIFITHFDKDHVGGFSEVMANVTADNIIVPNYEGNNDEYADYQRTVEEKGLKITSLTEDTDLILDDVLLQVSVPKKNSYAEGDNDFSLVISITHGENTFLFAGDAEEGRLPEVLSEFGKQYDFLKVPHHGKYNENTKRFINTVKPMYAVITDSEKNPASDKTVSLLESAGAKLYSTQKGDVSVVSDGQEIFINQ